MTETKAELIYQRNPPFERIFKSDLTKCNRLPKSLWKLIFAFGQSRYSEIVMKEIKKRTKNQDDVKLAERITAEFFQPVPKGLTAPPGSNPKVIWRWAAVCLRHVPWFTAEIGWAGYIRNDLAVQQITQTLEDLECKPQVDNVQLRGPFLPTAARRISLNRDRWVFVHVCVPNNCSKGYSDTSPRVILAFWGQGSTHPLDYQNDPPVIVHNLSAEFVHVDKVLLDFQ